MSIIRTWQSMTEADKMAMLEANIIKAMNTEMTKAQRAEHSPDEFYGAAWERIAERLTDSYLDGLDAKRAAAGKQPITLVSLIYRACKDAIRGEITDSIKHDHAPLDWTDDETGNQAEAYYLYRGNQHRTTEDMAVNHVFWDGFMDGKDHIDRIIIESLRDGYTQREAAHAAQVTAVAIHKRVKKLRRELTAAIA